MNYVNYTFPDSASAQNYSDNKWYENVLLAGVKVSMDGTIFVSTPRWMPGVPATLSTIDNSYGMPLLRPFPSWAANQEGNVSALQSVLGFEIDPCNRVWVLDQGKVAGNAALPGSIKLVVYNASDGTELWR